MLAYFIRRILLVPFTLLGVTVLVFGLTRIMPGGPLEQQMQKAMAEEGGNSQKSNQGSSTLSAEQKLSLLRQYNMDLPGWKAYLCWLGVLPRDLFHRDFQLVLPPTGADEAQLAGARKEFFLPIRNAQGGFELKEALLELTSGGEVKLQLKDSTDPGNWKARFLSADEKQAMAAQADGGAASAPEGAATEDNGERHVVVHQERVSGILQGDFGLSLLYGDRVGQLIKERLPISAFYAILTFIITYTISIPLGIVKAIRHRTLMDSATSVLVFIGYAIPGFALGTILLLVFSFQLEWFPMRDFVSQNFADLSPWEKIVDLFRHNILPLICYIIGSFALTTMIMKNSLMDNLAADYVRTAIAKGAGYNRAVFVHAARNSLIPTASTIGGYLAAFVGGSILIESVFDIYGMGLLSYNSLVGRDYPVVMAILTLATLLTLLGNIISDFLVASLDPKIRFD